MNNFTERDQTCRAQYRLIKTREMGRYCATSVPELCHANSCSDREPQGFEGIGEYPANVQPFGEITAPGTLVIDQGLLVTLA